MKILKKERLEKIIWDLINNIAEHYYIEDYKKTIKKIFTKEEIKQLNLLEEE